MPPVFTLHFAIKDKMTLSIEEAAAYSGIGMNKLRELTKSPFCDFVLYVGKKNLIKRVPFEEYINRATEVWFAFLTLRQYIEKRAYLC